MNIYPNRKKEENLLTENVKTNNLMMTIEINQKKKKNKKI